MILNDLEPLAKGLFDLGNIFILPNLRQCRLSNRHLHGSLLSVLPNLGPPWLFSVLGFVTVGLFTITRFLVSVGWPFVSVRVLMTVSVLLGILVSISVSVIQRADSGWPSPSVFFHVIVFGWNGIVTVFDIQGLFFCSLLEHQHIHRLF